MDEVYIVAGHKGQPDKVAAQQRQGRRRRRKGQRGRGTADKDKPPVLGMIERGGQVFLKLLDNVQQKTIQPVMEQFISKNTLIYTDEYTIYDRLTTWGYDHKTVCHAKAEYARSGSSPSDSMHQVVLKCFITDYNLACISHT
ncbi:MAG: transposase [Trueperaceae bacterium]